MKKIKELFESFFNKRKEYERNETADEVKIEDSRDKYLPQEERKMQGSIKENDLNELRDLSKPKNYIEDNTPEVSKQLVDGIVEKREIKEDFVDIEVIPKNNSINKTLHEDKNGNTDTVIEGRDNLENSSSEQVVSVFNNIGMNKGTMDGSISRSKFITNENLPKPAYVKTKNKQSKHENYSKKVVSIYQSLNFQLKEIIDEINCRYYIKMQPKEGEVILPKEYYKVLEEMKKVNAKERKRRINIIRNYLKELYKENNSTSEYIKKYDKLQSILECKSTNKRAKIELMLVLINEGYREVVKKSFPKRDYDFIEGIIKQYKDKTLSPQQARKSIDEYCL